MDPLEEIKSEIFDQTPMGPDFKDVSVSVNLKSLKEIVKELEDRRVFFRLLKKELDK